VLALRSVHAQTATVTILHSFNGFSDGAGPSRRFIKANDGNFYAPVPNVAKAQGVVETIVKVTSGGDFSVLHTFPQDSSTEGAYPNVLIQGSDGNLYGVCQSGGTQDVGEGTFYRLALDGTFTKLFDFGSDTDPGGAPNAPKALVEGSDGNFYGLTAGGGQFQPGGTFFRLTPGGQLTELYDFDPESATGAAPYVQLLVGKDGKFYGITSLVQFGGVLASGLFAASQNGEVMPLYIFQKGDADGSTMDYPLIQGLDGALYGASGMGGANDDGAIFRFSLSDKSYSTIYSFNDVPQDGSEPDTSLIEASDGIFYGALYYGAPPQPNGQGAGSYFAVTRSGGYTNMAVTNPANNGPRLPIAGLTAFAPNVYVGVTAFGGVDDGGTVVKLTVTPGTPTPPPGTPTPTPGTPTPTPTPGTPTPTPCTSCTPTPTPTPCASCTPTPTPGASPARALNISTRMEVQTGNNVLIGGFIVTGTGADRVIVRGIGPSLTGIGNALADPMLALHGPSGFTTVMNNNWRDTQEAEIIGTGVAPTNDLESAIVAMLDPGAYTAILSGNDNGTGVGLVEVYDLNQGGASQLANISTRGFVLTGNDVMIGGFILGGNSNTHVVVRGIGPSLPGVSPVLADPTLELHDSSGTTLAMNDNWQDDAASAAELTSLGLAPTNTNESGIYTSLPPGAFTVILAGKNGGTGIGLVEIYNVQ
jgi:uncharacterized repeat protein (TIGR03803 family)